MDAELRDSIKDMFEGSDRLNLQRHETMVTNVKRVEDKVEGLSKDVTETNLKIASLPCDAHETGIKANKDGLAEMKPVSVSRILGLGTSSAAGGAGLLWLLDILSRQ